MQNLLVGAIRELKLFACARAQSLVSCPVSGIKNKSVSKEGQHGYSSIVGIC